MSSQAREETQTPEAGNLPVFEMDNFCGTPDAPAPAPQAQDTDSLVEWALCYFRLHVAGSPAKTEAAKRKDLQRFLEFYTREMGQQGVDGWTPAVTKHFQHALEVTLSPISKEVYKATTVNRVMATLRHFGRWLDKQRPLMGGDPFLGVKDIQADAPDWNGLTDRQIMRLKSACEQRLNACRRGDQNPLLERAVFLTLLNTGLREAEVCSLDIAQYHHRGFHDVARKGKRVSKKVPLPAEGREALDAYLAGRGNPEAGPLFVSRYGARLAPQDVARICLRLARQACAHLPATEAFHLTPHMLRHTFLKRVADRYGVHVAQQMSGNISVAEIFRYTKPSQQQMDETAEKVFD